MASSELNGPQRLELKNSNRITEMLVRIRSAFSPSSTAAIDQRRRALLKLGVAIPMTAAVAAVTLPKETQAHGLHVSSRTAESEVSPEKAELIEALTDLSETWDKYQLSEYLANAAEQGKKIGVYKQAEEFRPLKETNDTFAIIDVFANLEQLLQDFRTDPEVITQIILANKPVLQAVQDIYTPMFKVLTDHQDDGPDQKERNIARQYAKMRDALIHPSEGLLDQSHEYIGHLAYEESENPRRQLTDVEKELVTSFLEIMETEYRGLSSTTTRITIPDGHTNFGAQMIPTTGNMGLPANAIVNGLLRQVVEHEILGHASPLEMLGVQGGEAENRETLANFDPRQLLKATQEEMQALENLLTAAEKVRSCYIDTEFWIKSVCSNEEEAQLSLLPDRRSIIEAAEEFPPLTDEVWQEIKNKGLMEHITSEHGDVVSKYVAKVIRQNPTNVVMMLKHILKLDPLYTQSRSIQKVISLLQSIILHYHLDINVEYGQSTQHRTASRKYDTNGGWSDISPVATDLITSVDPRQQAAYDFLRARVIAVQGTADTPITDPEILQKKARIHSQIIQEIEDKLYHPLGIDRKINPFQMLNLVDDTLVLIAGLYEAGQEPVFTPPQTDSGFTEAWQKLHRHLPEIAQGIVSLDAEELNSSDKAYTRAVLGVIELIFKDYQYETDLSILPFYKSLDSIQLPQAVADYRDSIAENIAMYQNFSQLKKHGYQGEYIAPVLEKSTALNIAPFVLAYNPSDGSFDESIFSAAVVCSKSLQTEFADKSSAIFTSQVFETTRITSQIEDDLLSAVRQEWMEAELLIQNYYYVDGIPFFRPENLVSAASKVSDSVADILNTIDENGAADSQVYAYIQQTASILTGLIGNKELFHNNWYHNIKFVCYLFYRLRLSLFGMYCEPRDLVLDDVEQDTYGNYVFSSPKNVAHDKKWEISLPSL